MFQTTIAVLDDHDQKYVSGNRRFFCFGFEKGDFGFADFLEIGFDPFQIKVRDPSGDGDFMWYSECLESTENEISHFNGRIDQLVIIFRFVSAEPVAFGSVFGQCRGDPP